MVLKLRWREIGKQQRDEAIQRQREMYPDNFNITRNPNSSYNIVSLLEQTPNVKGCCIYAIIGDRSVYVGLTSVGRKRFLSHISNLHTNEHTCYRLQRYANLHGLESLKFIVLTETNKDQLELFEAAIALAINDYTEYNLFNSDAEIKKFQNILNKHHVDAETLKELAERLTTKLGEQQ